MKTTRQTVELPKALEDGVDRVKAVIGLGLSAICWNDRKAAERLWSVWRGPSQTPPEGDWRIWLMMGGRGAGKTRAGAEWVRDLVEKRGVKRIALVGPTLHDVREVMIEGPSGLKAVAS